MEIVCDFPEIEPFVGDINDLIASYIKDINEVAEEDPNAYSYDESEMKDLQNFFQTNQNIEEFGDSTDIYHS